MYYLKAFLLGTFLIVFGCSRKINQEVAKPIENSTTSQAFPDGWTGKWEGALEIFKENKIAQTIPMKMEIQKDPEGNYNWSTVYNDAAGTAKPYTLIPKDIEKGFFLLDEHNSIKIETYQFSNKLLSWYSVAGNLILASYELRNGQLIFEIFAGKDEPISKTGNTKIEEEDIPEVATFPIKVYQRGVLSRVKAF